MGIFDSAKDYADLLQVPEELAKVRLAYKKAMEEKMKYNRKCPRCGQHTLEVNEQKDADEKGSVYCAFRKRSSVTASGNVYYDYCGFEDVVESDKYFFMEDLAFDIVLVMASSLNIKSEKQVLRHLKTSWQEFIEIDTSEMLLTLMVEQ